MSVRYHQRGGQRVVPDYLCQRAGIAQAAPLCQRIPGRDLDAAVGALLLQVITPQMVAQTLAVHDELRTQAGEAERLRQLQVERAQYEADLAQRRYRRVDPDNRLVAEVLEAEWNDKLRVLAAAREAVEQQRTAAQVIVSRAERESLCEAVNQFAHFWRDPTTTDRERKRIVRMVLEDVTVQKGEQIIAQIRFKGGATRTLTVALPPPFAQSRLTSSATLVEIDRLLESYNDEAAAAQLNATGWTTYAGLPFQAQYVSALRRKHGLADRYTRLRAAGLLTARELGEQLGVSAQTIWQWYHDELIEGVCYNERGSCLFRRPAICPTKWQRQRQGRGPKRDD